MVRPGLDAGNAAELTEAPIGADETGAGSAPKGCETRAERTGYQVGRPLECGAETTGGNAAWSSSNEMWINRRSVLEMLRRRLTAELSGLEMRRDFCDSKRRDAFAGPLQRIVGRLPSRTTVIRQNASVQAESSDLDTLDRWYDPA